MVDDAVQLLFSRDAFLLETDVAERTIAAKLAEYLVPRFPQHNIDVEYNRHGIEPKMVNLPRDCRGGGLKYIYPDVVIHKRGHDEQNLLVIQIKKETNQESRDCDRAIIEAMKREFGYVRGLLIDLPAGPGASKRNATLKWL